MHKKNVIHRYIREKNVVVVVVGENWDKLAYESKSLCLQSIYKTYQAVDDNLQIMALIDFRDHHFVGLFSDKTGLYIGNASDDVREVVERMFRE